MNGLWPHRGAVSPTDTGAHPTASKQGRIGIGGFPYGSQETVQSFWGLGRNDLNTIWLHQHVGGFERFVGYYENSGEFIGHYVSWLKE